MFVNGLLFREALKIKKAKSNLNKKTINIIEDTRIKIYEKIISNDNFSTNIQTIFDVSFYLALAELGYPINIRLGTEGRLYKKFKKQLGITVNTKKYIKGGLELLCLNGLIGEDEIEEYYNKAIKLFDKLFSDPEIQNITPKVLALLIISKVTKIDNLIIRKIFNTSNTTFKKHSDKISI